MSSGTRHTAANMYGSLVFGDTRGALPLAVGNSHRRAVGADPGDCLMHVLAKCRGGNGGHKKLLREFLHLIIPYAITASR